MEDVRRLRITVMFETEYNAYHAIVSLFLDPYISLNSISSVPHLVFSFLLSFFFHNRCTVYCRLTMKSFFFLQNTVFGHRKYCAHMQLVKTLNEIFKYFEIYSGHQTWKKKKSVWNMFVWNKGIWILVKFIIGVLVVLKRNIDIDRFVFNVIRVTKNSKKIHK